MRPKRTKRSRTASLDDFMPKSIVRRFLKRARPQLTVKKKADFGDLKVDLPDKHGVYIVSIVDAEENQYVIYIGKAGSRRTNGTKTSQGIRGRVFNTRRGEKSGADYWLSILRRKRVTALVFQWAVTDLGDRGYTLPSLVEAELLQAHLDATGWLPLECVRA